ncbi:hypothetical protein SLS57_006328 [Botryosphaeria dothidea]
MPTVSVSQDSTREPHASYLTLALSKQEPTYEQSATEPGTVTMRWKVNMAIDLDVAELGEAFRVAGVEANRGQIASVAEAIMARSKCINDSDERQNIMARKAPQTHQMPFASPFQAPPVQPVQSPPVLDEPPIAFPTEPQAFIPGVSPVVSHAPTLEAEEPSFLSNEVQPASCVHQSPLPEVPSSIPEVPDTLPGAQAPISAVAAPMTAPSAVPNVQAAAAAPELEAASAA